MLQYTLVNTYMSDLEELIEFILEKPLVNIT